MQVQTTTGEKFFLQTPLYTVENTSGSEGTHVETIPVPEGSTVALYTTMNRAEEAIKNGQLTNVVPKRIGSDKELKSLLSDFQKKGIGLVSIDFDNRAGKESGRCLQAISIIDAK